MNNLYIKNAVILTMNKKMQIIKGGSLLIENGIIKEVFEHSNINPSNDFEIIDAQNAILMPGFINCHNHLSMSYFRSFASDLPLEKWLEQVWQVEDELNDEFTYYGTLIACIEALESGTTCVNDMYMFQTGTAKACINSGIRAYMSRCIMDLYGSLEARLKEESIFFTEYNGINNGLINVNMGIHAEYTCSEQAILKSYQFAKENGIRVHLHLSETKKEVEECISRHGVSPLRYLKNLGVLSVPTIAAHCVYFDSEELDIISDYGLYPVHNPSSNLKLGSGIAPVFEMLNRNIKVALGTDGNGSNNNLDMTREMFLASVIHKGIACDPTVIKAEEAIKMATVNGAEALGYNGGKIEKGAVADLIILKNDINLLPQHDLLGIIAYSLNAKNIDYTIVNGKTVCKNGEFILADKRNIINNFNILTEKLFKKYYTNNNKKEHCK